MKFDPSSGSVIINDVYLSSFAHAGQGRNAYSSGGFSQNISVGEPEGAMRLYVPLEFDRCPVFLNTKADNIYRSDDRVTVERIKKAASLPSRFITAYNAEFLASGVVSAFACCKKLGLSQICLRLTFSSYGGREYISFEREYSFSVLLKLVNVLLDRSQDFIAEFYIHEMAKTEELRRLSFPYGTVRGGQQELMLNVMKALRTGGKLVASAPTGTGKTMATLFPAVKALGERYIDRIFYLTGKTVTGRAALDAVKLLSRSAPHLRCIMLHSKERSCPCKENFDDCSLCPRLGAAEELSYTLRRDSALKELLSSDNTFDGKTVSSCAEKYSICPFELSLDLSEYCDVIICDYNYIFDNKAQFIRYFKEDRGENYAFLVDEAHNLPDRVREAYSASFSPRDIEPVSKLLSDGTLFDEELGASIEALSDAFNEIFELCREESTVISEKDGEKTVGYYRTDNVPQSLIRTSAELAKVCRRIKKEHKELSAVLKPVLSTVGSLVSSTTVSDEGFAFLAEAVGDSLTCSFTCLDPSHIITEMCSLAKGSVMFSATLDPLDYFTEVLGCSSCPSIRAESPFDPDNLSVTIYDGISTRLSDRRDTAPEVAEVIKTVIETKAGNYFVFFPSYAYMKTVLREVLGICPDIRAVMQKQGMTHSDREKFLELFRKKRGIVGFCVLGGVFSEGVDLVGDSLIGVIVVGYGLPGLSSELNLRSEYYDRKYGDGHLYAYEYPAINKLEQAAGRVIRTADDKGVVVLVDHRLSNPEIASKFPDFWPQIAATSDTDTLSVLLSRFWDRE